MLRFFIFIVQAWAKTCALAGRHRACRFWQVHWLFSGCFILNTHCQTQLPTGTTILHTPLHQHAILICSTYQKAPVKYSALKATCTTCSYFPLCGFSGFYCSLGWASKLRAFSSFFFSFCTISYKRKLT